MAECRLDAIIASIFAYSLLFGLTSLLYDVNKRQLVYSSKALYYSLTLHFMSVILLRVFYNFFRIEEYFVQTEGVFFKQLFLLLVVVQFLTSFSSIVSQWTSRARVATLYNEIIKIWHRDMAHLQWSADTSRESEKIFTCRTILTFLIITCTLVESISNVMGFETAVQSICFFLLSNIIIAVMFQFSSGMIFSDYLFRILNHNLTRVVQEIGDLCDKRGSRRRVVKLRKELTTIGRIHSHLQQWVVRFKNLYQIEFLLFLLTFFMSQIFTLFLACFVLRAGLTNIFLSRFLVACYTAILCAFDIILNFSICGRVLDASNGAAQIMKELPSHNLCCTRLERSIEMMCLQLKRAKLRLRICGLVDVDGNTGFAMTEAAMMYIILLIQIDYENF